MENQSLDKSNGKDRTQSIFSQYARFSHILSPNPQELDPLAYKFVRHTSETHQMLIFLSGDCKMVTDSGEQILQPGDVCFNRALTYYNIEILSNSPYERVVLFLNPDEKIDALYEKVFGNAGIVNVNLSKHLFPWISRFKEYAQRLPINEFSIISVSLLEELSYLCLMQKNNADYIEDTAETILKKALAYIDTYWQKIDNIKEISTALFISPSYLYEIFNKKFGIAPKTYLMQKRLQAAHAYLISGVQPCEVCQLVGFKTYTAFYRACKTFYKKSPQELWVKKLP